MQYKVTTRCMMDYNIRYRNISYKFKLNLDTLFSISTVPEINRFSLHILNHSHTNILISSFHCCPALLFAFNINVAHKFIFFHIENYWKLEILIIITQLINIYSIKHSHTKNIILIKFSQKLINSYLMFPNDHLVNIIIIFRSYYCYQNFLFCHFTELYAAFYHWEECCFCTWLEPKFQLDVLWKLKFYN